MACNYCFPTRTIFQINSEFWKRGTIRWENGTSCLVGLKTHPTIVPRSGIELTTSRLHSFIMAKVSHALNHSVMTKEVCVLLSQMWWHWLKCWIRSTIEPWTMAVLRRMLRHMLRHMLRRMLRRMLRLETFVTLQSCLRMAEEHL